MLMKPEAIAMTTIAICGLGCTPVSPQRRAEIQELLEGLWLTAEKTGSLHGHEEGYALGLQAGRAERS